MDKEAFGRRIASRRAALGMSRQDLAEGAGIAVSTLGPYERGEKLPAIDIAAAIAQKLEVSVDWLCGKEETGSGSKINNLGEAVRMISSLLVTKHSKTPLMFDTIYFANFRNNEIIIHPTAIHDGIDFSSWEKLVDLYRNATIDKEVYEAWIEKKSIELLKR